MHAIMGPNGSGKSTLSATLAGREDYEVVGGSVEFKGKDLLSLAPEDRAGEGILWPSSTRWRFPASAISSSCRLRLTRCATIAAGRVRPFRLPDLMEEKIKLLKMPEDLLTRSVNVGFSGGEKKRNDILQMAVLEPDLCILDESDSGLDIDALKIVSDGVNALRDGKRAFIIVTHYQRILDYIKPDYVHVLYQGRIVKSGDFTGQTTGGAGLWLAYRTAVTRCSSGIICLRRRASGERPKPASISSRYCASVCRRANMKTGNIRRWIP
ncbi:Fe-S cluster assembly ATPase SufC [Raoultella planticola]|uniref:Fe-S cluster assembly ATPase SufC n=1 Tax=Raoultella planticola TaxID=575 RepID=A0A5P6A9E2_RAOPL|nr:Fe-S cluster assembly ATPase SufC [Raoultella planticola]